MSRKVSELTPDMQIKFVAFAARMAENDLPFVLTCTLRTIEEQTAYFAQSRRPLAEVNRLRKIAGLYQLTEAENQRPVTWTMNSRHLPGPDGKSHAFDIAICKNGIPQWSGKVDVDADGVPDYEEAGKIGKALGLKWGGDFKGKDGKPRPDLPHFELV